MKYLHVIVLGTFHHIDESMISQTGNIGGSKWIRHFHAVFTIGQNNKLAPNLWGLRPSGKSQIRYWDDVQSKGKGRGIFSHIFHTPPLKN